MTVRFHLFPFRTQKLSSLVPKIVRWKRRVKIGSRRLEQKALREISGLFCCAIYVKGLQNGEKVGILRTERGENMRSDGTRKDSARPYAIIIALLIFCRIVFYVQTHYQHTSAIRPEDDYKGRIPQFHSCVDRDDDGVDDQSDILNGALAYVSTHPKYKSRYYKAGYPDDGYGVCTDVVAYALKNAGYDLQVLVNADIREQPQDYMVAEPDANIDFRRVRNLKVFFSHTAAALTTDVSEIEEWQGGDIVIFERHIGIVSDRRNKNGVPYIIHHNDPWQTAYEQDILEKRTDIVGHYRISE